VSGGISAQIVIQRLGLEPHPMEGGWFRETYRSAESTGAAAGTPGAGRSLSTAIYYLLTTETYSALHRLPGDEIFHFYLGDPVEMLLLDGGGARVVHLGPHLETMSLQQVVPGGSWQGARLLEGGEWALLGTTMAPGFDYADFEVGTGALRGRGGAHEALLEALLPPGTPPPGAGGG